jgi:hypothetical protein
MDLNEAVPPVLTRHARLTKTAAISDRKSIGDPDIVEGQDRLYSSETGLALTSGTVPVTPNALPTATTTGPRWPKPYVRTLRCGATGTIPVIIRTGSSVGGSDSGRGKP